MRHGEDDFLQTVTRRVIDGEIEQRNEAFGAFERKAFGADEFFLTNSSNVTASVSRARILIFSF